MTAITAVRSPTGSTIIFFSQYPAPPSNRRASASTDPAAPPRAPPEGASSQGTVSGRRGRGASRRASARAPAYAKSAMCRVTCTRSAPMASGHTPPPRYPMASPA